MSTRKVPFLYARLRVDMKSFTQITQYSGNRKAEITERKSGMARRGEGGKSREGRRRGKAGSGRLRNRISGVH